MELRKQKEIKFHNRREAARKADQNIYKQLTTNKKFYSIDRASRNFYNQWLAQRCKNKKVLDYCCGTGGTSIFLAKNGAEVTGIDISSESIKTCKEIAVKKSIDKNACFFVMDAEKTKFKDNSFDVIVCVGVLHHLDIQKAYTELARILKSDGEIICVEPLSYNPLIQLYRKLTPRLRTEWEAKHILNKKNILLAKEYFGEAKTNFFHFATIVGVPFRNSRIFEPMLGLLEKIDSFILKLPLIKWLAWQVVIILSEPKHD